MEVLDKDYVIKGPIDQSGAAKTLAEVGYSKAGSVREKFFVFSETGLVFVKREYHDKRGKLVKTERFCYGSAEESGTYGKFDNEFEFNKAVESVEVDSLTAAKARNNNPKKEPGELDVCALYVAERDVFDNKNKSLPKLTIGKLLNVRKPNETIMVATLEECDMDPKQYILNALKASRSGLEISDGVDIRAECAKKIAKNVMKEFTGDEIAVQGEEV